MFEFLLGLTQSVTQVRGLLLEATTSNQLESIFSVLQMYLSEAKTHT